MTMTKLQASALIGGWDWKTPTFFKFYMPYLYQRVNHPDRKHAYLPLNRDYAPLGFRRGEPRHLNYEELAVTHGVYFARDPATIDGVWHNVRGGSLWLYDDDPNTRRDYFERLERLLTKQVQMIG